MEFSEPYLMYEEYRALGGTLDLTPFNLLEFEARRRIDIRTQNRLKVINSNDMPQEVKICEFKMIDSMSSYDKGLSNIASNGNVASENTDGYSVSYITSDKVSDVISSKDKELNTIMYECLVGVIVNGEHIMYAGVR